MGASNLALDSILVSPKPGMDLNKGVSGNVGSKAESKSSQDFDRLLSRQSNDKPVHEISKPSAQKEHSKVEAKKVADAKDGDQPTRANERPKEVEHQDDQDESAEPSVVSTAKPSSDKKPEDAAATDGADIALQMAMLNQDGLKAQLQIFTENENISAAQVDTAKATVDMTAEPSTPIQWIALTQQANNASLKAATDQLKRADGATNQKMNETQADHTDVSLLDAVKMPESSESATASNLDELNLQDATAGKAGLPELGLQKDADSKSLKHLVDSLYVQQTLGTMPTDSNAQSLPSAKIDVTLGQVSPESVRTHLMNDIKPVIHDMVMKDKGGEMTVSLRPAHLGWIKVNVEVNDGSVKVALQTETTEAKSMLEGQMKDLHQGLKQSGLKIEEVSVAVSPNASSSKSSDSADARSSQNPHSDSEQSRRDSPEQRQNTSQRRHKEELFAEMMNERNAA